MSRLETMRNLQVRLRLGSNRSATFRGLKNWRNLGIVLVNIPFALVGVVIAVFAGGRRAFAGRRRRDSNPRAWARLFDPARYRYPLNTRIFPIFQSTQPIQPVQWLGTDFVKTWTPQHPKRSETMDTTHVFAQFSRFTSRYPPERRRISPGGGS